MDGSMFVILSGTLSFGVPLAVEVRELLVLRPGRGEGDRDPLPEITPPPPAPSAAGPTRPLPACLIPTLPPRVAVPRTTRQLEPV